MPKARKLHSCTQCIYTTERSHDLNRHFSRIHGEEQGQSRGRESSPETAIAVDNSPNAEIPEGTIIAQPEAAPDGEEDGYKSKVLKFPHELKERKDSNKQNAPPTVESVFCTACGTQVDPFDRKTFFCHPVLSVVICKICLESYNRCLWKRGKDGSEEECRWCGNKGQDDVLVCCDFCCRKFCKKCITLNFGENECKHIVSKKWKCYVCNRLPLKELADRCRKMQDAAIAEEFRQYLEGNISNMVLFMRSLKRLKSKVPDMQNLQMLLKHIGKVKSDLGKFEACVKKQLHGDAHKSDSVLDGIPGESSTGSSQDEGGKKEDKVERRKDLSAETVTRKSRRSSAASESESSENSDDNTKPRRRNPSRKKKKCEPEKIDNTKPRRRNPSRKKKKCEPEKIDPASEVELMRRELDDNDEKDNDADGDKDDEDDEDEEVDGTGSKRSKKKAVKKAEEDEEWNNSERRQNGTEGGGGSRDDKNGGGDQKKRKRRDPIRDLYKKAKKKKKFAQEEGSEEGKTR